MNSLRKQLIVPVFYLLLFAALATAAFFVLSASKTSIRNSNEVAGTIRKYNLLLRINQQADELQMATLRIIFNPEEGDVEKELEYKQLLELDYEKSWEELSHLSCNEISKESFTALLEFKNRAETARRNLTAYATDAKKGQDAAIDLYYNVEKPQYEAYQHEIKNTSLFIKKSIDEQLSRTNAYVRDSSGIVNSLLVFSFIIMVIGGLLIIHQQERFNKVQSLLIAERSDTHAKITRESLAAQERERNELGRELHDNVNQVLSVVKLNLSMVAEQKDRMEQLLPKSIKHLEQAIEEIRTLSKFLADPVANRISLYDSIRELIAAIKPVTTGTHFILFMDDVKDTSVCDELKLTIYRILQEQMNNIIKHADASRVRIDVRISKSDISLRVQDDGRGFDPSALRKGVGINNITSRAYAYQGFAEFDTAPGKGCTLNVRLPLNQQKKSSGVTSFASRLS